MQNAFDANKNKRNKIKLMITEQIAETPLTNGAPEQKRVCCNRQIQPPNNPVPGHILLDELESLLTRFVILPTHAAETLALWILHTYAFELRDVSTYLGIESPEKRCGKTTLLSVLNRLVNRPVAAANISPSAFFRVIEEMRPTLLIDEADTFLRGNDELRGILNAGCTPDTSYVVRVAPPDPNQEFRSSRRKQAPSTEDFPLQNCAIRNPNSALAFPSSPDTRHSSRLLAFSCWCPKALAAIGRLPDTLADRCIIIRMQRKHIDEDCQRLRHLQTTTLRQRCVQFVAQNQAAIASAEPEFPDTLHDRAADIWEPLLVLADLAGGEWPAKARRAAEGLTANAQGRSPIGSLLFDIFYGLLRGGSDRIFSRDLVAWLNRFTDRPWMDLPGLRSVDPCKRKEITELWIAQQLRPYGIRPRTIRIADNVAKGYIQEDLEGVFQRYVPRSELDNFKAEALEQEKAISAQAASKTGETSAANGYQPQKRP
jgi:putative DNA primase/helicase